MRNLSNQRYRRVLSCGTIYCAVQVGSSFEIVYLVYNLKMKATEQNLLEVIFELDYLLR